MFDTLNFIDHDGYQKEMCKINDLVCYFCRFSHFFLIHFLEVNNVVNKYHRNNACLSRSVFLLFPLLFVSSSRLCYFFLCLLIVWHWSRSKKKLTLSVMMNIEILVWRFNFIHKNQSFPPISIEKERYFFPCHLI
jgi:hypothetical protein